MFLFLFLFFSFYARPEFLRQRCRGTVNGADSGIRWMVRIIDKSTLDDQSLRATANYARL